jgi:uncharacterized cupin superfamily protein
VTLNLLHGAAGTVVEGELYGATLYELEPGGATAYHWHVGDEEFLLVLAGRPTLRTPLGERELRPWDVAWFARGEEGAHQVRNEAAEPARVLLLSTRSDPEVVVHPDDGTVTVTANWSRDAAATIRGRVEPE